MSKTNHTLERMSDALASAGITPEKGKRLSKAHTRDLMKAFEAVEDGRVPAMCDYPLHEILLLVFMGVLSDCNKWTEIEAFGVANLRWLRKFYPYKNGTPSHDTLKYTFARISPEQFQKVMVHYITANIRCIRKCLQLDPKADKLVHYAIDGKEENGTGRSYCTARGEKVRNQQTLHVWNVTDDICIYSEHIESKTNEIPVAQKFLQSQKSLEGILVTFDALHTQKKTWKIILGKKGQCIGGLK